MWQQLLRHPDRFTSVDSALFLDPEITSREYGLRHAHDVVHDEAELLAAFALDRAGDLEDVLYADHDYDGDVIVNDDGVELLVGREGTVLEYPFRVTELRELADELRWRSPMKIEVVRGNITTQDVEAIVTAGNSALRGGSGVNGAVHAAAGPRLLAASRALAPCPAGCAVITPGVRPVPSRSGSSTPSDPSTGSRRTPRSWPRPTRRAWPGPTRSAPDRSPSRRSRPASTATHRLRQRGFP